MKEKILAALKTKFPGTDEATLLRIAEKKASGVTDENQIATITEGVGFQDVLNSYGDFRANGAVSSAVTNYEKKYNLKDGKPVENPNPIPNPNPEQPDMAKMIADAVMKPLSDKLSVYEQKETQAQRGVQILAKAKEYGISETLIPMLKIADDADLDTFFKDAKQTFANEGFQGAKTPDSVEQQIGKESDTIANMISDGTKTIVESKK